MVLPSPLVPDYDGACTSSVIPELLRFTQGQLVNEWVPSVPAGPGVLFVIDGLGWEQLQARRHLAPTLANMVGGAITTTVPSTTPSCLTSIITGTPPALHGIAGFRLSVGYKQVMDVKRWTVDGFDAREQIRPASFQTQPPFRGADVPSIVRHAFIGGGLTDAQFGNTRLIPYAQPSSISIQAHKLLSEGNPLVYAYYDGLDVVAHVHGLGAEYDAELRFVDRLVTDIVESLPAGATLFVTADHGHVNLDDGHVNMASEVVNRSRYLSGEARFRWLHVADKDRDDVAKMCHDLYDEIAWIRTYDEAVDENWFGGVPSPEIRSRLGDIVIAAHAPLGFLEPGSTSLHLKSRHGSLTSAEILVPFIAGAR